MSTVIPALFAALGALSLLAVVYFAWQGLRSALGVASLVDVVSEGASARRLSLLHQKDALLEDLRDLRFDHEAGKLSDADFEKLEAKIRGQATATLRALDDDVAPYRAAAEALLAARLGGGAATRPSSRPSRESAPPAASAPSLRICPSCTVGNASDAVFCKKCGGRLLPIPCTACGTVNDADATFCKKCGGSLEEAARASAPAEPAS